MQNLKFLAIFVVFLTCNCEYLDFDPNYPEEILNGMDLWRYEFDSKPRSERSANLDSNSYLVETKLCDSKISFIRPQQLKNVDDKIRTIVNHQNYTQFVRMEICNAVNFPCTFDIYPRSVRSFCQQYYRTINFLAFDNQKRCLVTEKFNVPSSCACVIDKEDLLNGVKKDLLQQSRDFE